MVFWERNLTTCYVLLSQTTYNDSFFSFRTHLDFPTPTSALNWFEQVLHFIEKHFVKLYKDGILRAKSDNVLSTSITDHL